MIILFIIIVYSLVKGKQMFRREEWSLVQQEVVSGLGELSKTYNLNETEYKNISIALQFYPKKAKQTRAAKQQALIEQAREDFELRQNEGGSGGGGDEYYEDGDFDEYYYDDEFSDDFYYDDEYYDEYGDEDYGYEDYGYEEYGDEDYGGEDYGDEDYGDEDYGVEE